MDNGNDKSGAGANGRVLQIDPAAHKVADVLLPWLVNGTLEGDELAFVQQHVAVCPRCQREVDWLREFHAACAAGEKIPGGSPALGSLRRKLDARTEDRGILAQLRDSRFRSGWTRWVIAAEFAVIALLGGVLLHSIEQPSLYRTLGAGNAAISTGALVVVFDPATPEGDLRRILRDVEARLIDGPTQANAYVLDVPPSRREQAVRELKSNPAVVLVEGLESKGNR
jgi:Putative zinc-finger/Fervidolysin N-terminal prodomain